MASHKASSNQQAGVLHNKSKAVKERYKEADNLTEVHNKQQHT
jgi:hypothetical protein